METYNDLDSINRFAAAPHTDGRNNYDYYSRQSQNIKRTFDDRHPNPSPLLDKFFKFNDEIKMRQRGKYSKNSQINN